MTPDEQALEELAQLLGRTTEWLRAHGAHRVLERHKRNVLCADYVGRLDARAVEGWEDEPTPTVRYVREPE